MWPLIIYDVVYFLLEGRSGVIGYVMLFPSSL